jgi:hypothetical protein
MDEFSRFSPQGQSIPLAAFGTTSGQAALLTIHM